jgi:hypothetical protein
MLALRLLWNVNCSSSGTIRTLNLADMHLFQVELEQRPSGGGNWDQLAQRTQYRNLSWFDSLSLSLPLSLCVRDISQSNGPESPRSTASVEQIHQCELSTWSLESDQCDFTRQSSHYSYSIPSSADLSRDKKLFPSLSIWWDLQRTRFASCQRRIWKTLTH